MKQLYALIEENSFSQYQDKFPDAVTVGEYRLGVFLDTDRDELECLDGLTVLNYEQAKEFVKPYQEAEL